MSTFNQLAPTVSQIINSSAVLVTGNAVSANALTVRQFGTGNLFSAQTTSGSTALFVGANGNVGVGTTGPVTPFTVHGTNNQATFADLSLANPNSKKLSVFYQDPSGVSPYYFSSFIGKSLSSDGSNFTIHTDGVNRAMSAMEFGTFGINFYSNVQTTQSTDQTGVSMTALQSSKIMSIRATVGGAGRVGIGTDSPGNLLQIGSAVDAIYTPLSQSNVIIFGNSPSMPTTAGTGTIGGTLFINSTNASASNVGASIALGGRGYNFGGGEQHMTFARIQGTRNLSGSAYAGDFVIETQSSGALYERMRITSAGNVGIGTASPDAQYALTAYPFSGSGLYAGYNSATVMNFAIVGSTINGGWNGGAAIGYFSKNASTNRSVNASGTINANAADYAEYMTKSGDFTILKGDVIGVNAHGLLTNIFSESVTFVVKSTDPSYVGGDSWGTEEALGISKPNAIPETDPGYGDYQIKLGAFNAAYEKARTRVDRIAFCGQVPVNVLGATPGQYIVPVANADGSISGTAVSTPTFEQYTLAVGKVIKVLPDGRAQIIVKIV
jgi:hypothetical protein